MANTAMWFRSLGVALVLLVAMLYLSSLNLKTLGPRNVVDAGSNYRPTKDSIPSYSEHVAAEFRHGRQSVNSSIAAQDQGFYGGPEQTNEVFVPHDSRLVKRELGQEWNCLVETGWKGLVEGIFLAIEGHPFPTPNWGKVNEKLLKAHGWERNRDDTATLPEVWKDAFQMMPKALPHYIENTRMTWVHVLPYSYEDRRQRVPTLAQYSVLYIPGAKAIISIKAHSPQYMVRIRPAFITPDRSIPRLERLSDIVWLDWLELMPEPGELRYFAREQVLEPSIMMLLDEIFLDRRKKTDVPWSERITFDIDAREFLAILGSDHGSALVWLMIHQAKTLGWRTLEVTIFNPGGQNRCIIWDLMPPPATEGVFPVGTFGNLEPPDYCEDVDPPPYCRCSDCFNWPGWLPPPRGHRSRS